MLEINKLISIIEEIAPLSLAETWDHCGIQVGTADIMTGRKIGKVLTALEITNEVIDEATAYGVDFILVHHPMFDTYQTKLFDKKQGGYRFCNFNTRLSENHIAVYAAHTSFDSAEGGNNDYLAKLLKLKNVSRFDDTGARFDENIGVKGELEEALPFAEFCKTISSALNLSSGELRATVPRKVQPERLMIKNVGLCTGAGCDMAELAAANGCDAFVTGDMKYHVAQRFCEKGICVIDAGHYGTEKFFSENMARLLQTRTDGKIEIIVSKMDINPFLFF